MFLQALSSCLANKSRAKNSSLPSLPRALKQPTKTTAGMSFPFRSTFESLDILKYLIGVFLKPVDYLLSSLMFAHSRLMTNTCGTGS